MDSIERALEDYGISEADYRRCLNDIIDKLNGLNDIDWQDIIDKYNLPIAKDTLRKASAGIFGGKFVAQYMRSRENNLGEDEKLDELRKERMKLQTLNVERNRLDRSLYRQELFYEYVGQMVKELPWPEFKPLFPKTYQGEKEYCLCLADLHYGSTFKSENNEYSPTIAKERFEYLLDELIAFVKDKQLNHINVLELGDSVCGMLRLSDIKLNDSSVVQSVVEVSRLIAWFLNELSAYVEIDYHHVPTSNHTRIPLTKPNELPNEDLEFIIGNYIKDLLVLNDRVSVNFNEDNKNYVMLKLLNSNIVAMHGHQFVKNNANAVKNISMWTQQFINTVIIGHQHGGKMQISHELGAGDAEILVASSFIGSDPYSDTLQVGAKAACNIFGFSHQGHVESYKIILN